MLKKACIFTLTLVVAVALSACSAVQSVTGAQSPTTQAGGTGSQSGQSGSSGSGGTNAQVTISPETRYAIGTLKLEGTSPGGYQRPGHYLAPALESNVEFVFQQYHCAGRNSGAAGPDQRNHDGRSG